MWMVKNMGNNRRTAARQKLYLVTGIVTVAALVAMVGVYQNINNGEQSQNQLAQNESQTNLADGDVDYGPGSGVEYDASDYEEWAAVADDVDGQETQAAMAERNTLDRNDGTNGGNGTENADGSVQNHNADTTGTGRDSATVIEGEVSENSKSQATFSNKEELSFGKGSTINWPVQGNVLMNYSMDKSVYFATLDQYKYNPAIIIQANVNDKVLAGAKGTIEDIETNENTGLTVTVDLGSGYKAVYGQLKEVKKEVGDALNPEDVLGYIAEPTKYYSVEGSNLYFAMTRDGEPVNPMEYLK